MVEEGEGCMYLSASAWDVVGKPCEVVENTEKSIGK